MDAGRQRTRGVRILAVRGGERAGRDSRHFIASQKRDEWITQLVVIADEAHRSQYDFIDGFARHMRDALLPKLISGELRVKDAERFLKERGL
jgi:hypothetical protein